MDFINGLLSSKLTDYGTLILSIVVLVITANRLQKQVEHLESKIEKLEERIEQITTDFITKEQHYQDVSGWRGEIRKLEDRMERIMDKLLEIVKTMEVRR